MKSPLYFSYNDLESLFLSSSTKRCALPAVFLVIEQILRGRGKLVVSICVGGMARTFFSASHGLYFDVRLWLLKKSVFRSSTRSHHPPPTLHLRFTYHPPSTTDLPTTHLPPQICPPPTLHHRYTHHPPSTAEIYIFSAHNYPPPHLRHHDLLCKPKNRPYTRLFLA